MVNAEAEGEEEDVDPAIVKSNLNSDSNTTTMVGKVAAGVPVVVAPTATVCLHRRSESIITVQEQPQQEI